MNMRGFLTIRRKHEDSILEVRRDLVEDGEKKERLPSTRVIEIKVFL